MEIKNCCGKIFPFKTFCVYKVLKKSEKCQKEAKKAFKYLISIFILVFFVFASFFSISILFAVYGFDRFKFSKINFLKIKILDSIEMKNVLKIFAVASSFIIPIPFLYVLDSLFKNSIKKDLKEYILNLKELNAGFMQEEFSKCKNGNGSLIKKAEEIIFKISKKIKFKEIAKMKEAFLEFYLENLKKKKEIDLDFLKDILNDKDCENFKKNIENYKEKVVEILIENEKIEDAKDVIKDCRVKKSFEEFLDEKRIKEILDLYIERKFEEAKSLEKNLFLESSKNDCKKNKAVLFIQGGGDFEEVKKGVEILDEFSNEKGEFNEEYLITINVLKDLKEENREKIITFIEKVFKKMTKIEGKKEIEDYYSTAKEIVEELKK